MLKMVVFVFSVLASWTVLCSQVVYTGRVEKRYEPGLNMEIYLYDLSTNERTRLTRHEGGDWDPSLSRNGKYVAFNTDRFKSSRHTDTELALMDIRTKEVRHINVGFWKYTRYPTFSKDSQFLYFVTAGAPRSGKPMSHYEIFQYHIKTKSLKQLTETEYGSHFDLSVSPNGKWLAYRRSKDSDQELKIRNLDNGEIRVIDPNRPFRKRTAAPSWKSNNEIIFSANYGVLKYGHDRVSHLINLKTEERSQVLLSNDFYLYESICWLNENEGVFAAVDDYLGRYRLYYTNWETGEMRALKETDSEYASSNQPDC